jgi:hypothetical protein
MLHHKFFVMGKATTVNYWLIKAEPESRLEKGVDVKVTKNLNSFRLKIWRNAVSAHGKEFGTTRLGIHCGTK